MNVHSSKNHIDIYGFYHICCIGDWKEIVIEQVNSLTSSPLFQLSTKIYVCALISEDNDLNILNEILPAKFTLQIVDTNLELFEYPILRFMHQKAQNEEFYAFYFHSKGVSVNKNKKRGVPYWRKELEYFLFYKCDLMLNAFELNYNTYGANLRAFPKWSPHFCGNFWFAKSAYIKTLPLIPLDIYDRYYAEEWIGKNKDMNSFVPYNTFIDLYHVPLPRLFYNKTLPIRLNEIFDILLFIYYKLRSFVYKKQNIE
ncbi:MAG: hypothetical protein PWP52_393 [Bacteroidales bacterium]|nr:hypothetical protein [Bacteroidales bacterium]